MSVVASRQHERERQVEGVVKRHPECLDQYRALILWYWCEIDGAVKYDPKTATFSIQTWNLYRLTSPEAVSRALRRLIEKKIIIINKENKIWRDQEEQHYHETYSKREEFSGGNNFI